MSILHTRRFSSWARGHLLCSVDEAPDRFAITFDDGPNPNATDAVLDVLARHDARATFFMLGGHVRRRPALARRVVAAGHEAAVHGDTHWPMPLLLPGAMRGQVRRCAASIEDATGTSPRFYRPPFGLMTPGQARFIRGLGFEPVLGDVYPEDPHRPGAGRIATRVLRRLSGGSILILHDGSPFGAADRSQTVEALGVILGEMRRRGLRGVTVAELVGARKNF
ncbi:MAG TPA: polysaccharide deacetylase family protein [Candidatus Omnitrophota bacterium]|jgi:peptidoglycan/xylan/chitin deacetylase (PgdA/CDA1 family)|nr:polysaccharide deacetylase family protein [Candidatus Omnitrophota bacterium]